jgi:hypothetical protein
MIIGDLKQEYSSNKPFEFDLENRTSSVLYCTIGVERKVQKKYKWIELLPDIKMYDDKSLMDYYRIEPRAKTRIIWEKNNLERLLPIRGLPLKGTYRFIVRYYYDETKTKYYDLPFVYSREFNFDSDL